MNVLNRNKKNKLIAVEGMDGVGKSEITLRLVNALNAIGVSSIAIKSPIGDYHLSAGYVNLKCDVNSRYLFYLSGIKHTSDLIREYLSDYTVVCDRYIYSTEAYHKAQNLSVVVDLESLNILEPDYKFYITVSDEEIRRNRLIARGLFKPGDEEMSGKGSLIERIENNFKNFNLLEIDNTYRALDDVVEEILAKMHFELP
jgi:dTMP kinase